MPKCDLQSCKATLLKSHFGMSVLRQICCIFSEHLFQGTPLGNCFCSLNSSPEFDFNNLKVLE